MSDRFQQYADLDPAPDPDALSESAWTDHVLLDVIDERSRDRHRLGAIRTRPVGAWRGALVAVAVFAMVSIAGVVIVLASRGGGGDVAPVNTVTSVPTVPTSTVVEEVEPVSPSTTLVPEAPEVMEPSAPITGMAWQPVTPDGIAPASDSGMTALVSGGDRFLYVDVPNNTVGTSLDGSRWTSESIQGSLDVSIGSFSGWQDTVVGFGCGGWVGFDGEPMTAQPGCVSVIQADGTVASQSFDAQINAAGIGPSGIIAIVTNDYDENGLQYLAEHDLATGLTGRDWEAFDGSVIEIVDGVLHIEFRDGLVSDYVLADYGYTDAESQVASGWFSQDGDEWTPILDFPSAINPDGIDWQVIGTRDGFVAISDDRNGGQVAWHSSDGLDWRELGSSSGAGWALNPWLSPLSRWRDGAIVIGAESIWYVSGGGITEMPLATTGLDELVAFASDNAGIVMVNLDIDDGTIEPNQVLHSPDGQDWINTSVPPEMHESLTNLGWPMFARPIEAAATDTVVLMRLSVGGIGQQDSPPVWFLGTPTTD